MGRVRSEELGAAVDVEGLAGDVRRLVAAQERGGGGDVLGVADAADRVVLAVPPWRAREVAPGALPDDPGLGTSPIVNVHLWYDRPVMDEPFTAVVDSPAQWIFNRTAMGAEPEPGRAPDGTHHLAVSISGAHT